MTKEIKAFKCERCNELTNMLVQQGSILEWIEDLLEGNEVSDFALSFPLVRQISDLKEIARRE